MKLFKGFSDFISLKGFRDFILRGNLVDLAVAFVIGAAFSGLVQAFVSDLITPLIGIPGKLNFPNWTFSVHGSPFHIGHFLNTLISFLIMALVLFFFVVRPMTALLDRIKRHEKQPEPDKRECPFCFNEIPIKATRCGFCTSDVAPPGAVVATVPAAPGAREPVS